MRSDRAQPSPDWPDGPLDARKVKLIDVLEEAGTKALRYLYDHSDGWEHTIKVERPAAPELDAAYPRLIPRALDAHTRGSPNAHQSRL